MILEEAITVSEKEIVERAIELLAKHKHLIFKLEQCETGLFCDSGIRIVVSDLTLTDFNKQTVINVSYDMFKEQRTDSEPKNICFDDIIALRIAKILFDWHKAQEYKQLAGAVNNTCRTSQATVTLNPGKLDTQICLNPNIHIAEVDVLTQKIKDLEDLNKKLTDEVNDIKVILRKKEFYK